MHLTFKETKEEVYAAQRVSKHVSPHLHNALEIVCVTEGTLEMGVGQELYHMEKGDIGFEKKFWTGRSENRGFKRN